MGRVFTGNEYEGGKTTKLRARTRSAAGDRDVSKERKEETKQIYQQKGRERESEEESPHSQSQRKDHIIRTTYF